MKSDTWLKDLYDANYTSLYKLAANRLRLYAGHASDAQDVLQDVFLEASKQNIHNHPNPEGWLILTTVNFCKNYTRTNTRHERKQRKCEQDEIQKSNQSSLLFVGSAKDETTASDIMMTLEQVLSPEDLRLLEEYCINDRPLDEIGKEMHMTPNALRVRIFRIRKKLKKYFP